MSDEKKPEEKKDAAHGGGAAGHGEKKGILKKVVWGTFAVLAVIGIVAIGFNVAPSILGFFVDGIKATNKALSSLRSESYGLVFSLIIFASPFIVVGGVGYLIFGKGKK